ncbi:putative E3 ubiquitin-protein ligase UBR7 isoform 2-T2 [Polymixia lowei]
MAADEEEATVSLVDVLEEDEELENEASAVLGGSNSEQCSYPEEKEQVNSENQYSHNFFGLYCTCNRPYPDPEDQVEDEMIQCIICEDWLHGRHLGCLVPDCLELQEMVCQSCMNTNPFLWSYAAHLTVCGVAKGSPGKAEGELKKEEYSEEERRGGTEEASTSLLSREEKEKAPNVPSCKRSRQEMEGGCRLKELQAIGQERVQSGAVFWPSAWRSKLCPCVNCKKSYAAAGVSFLVDESDTVLAYENKGKSSEQEQEGHDPLMSALDNLNRVQQLEIIHEYNDMKTELKDFLQRFAAEGKVVTPEDIRQFFEQQQSRKRRRANAGQFYCS